MGGYLVIKNVPFANMGLKNVVIVWLRYSFFNLWFLTAILFLSLVFLMVHALFKDNCLIHLAIIIGALFFPNFYDFPTYFFIYPYFAIGYFMHRDIITRKMIVRMFEVHREAVMCCGMLFITVFVVMLLFYKGEHYIYLTQLSVVGKGINQLITDVFRWGIGLGGIFSLIAIDFYLKSLIKIKICNWMFNVICEFGKYSMGIYITSTLIWNDYLRAVSYSFDEFSYTNTVIEACIVLGLSYLTVLILDKYSAKLFLGKIR